MSQDPSGATLADLSLFRSLKPDEIGRVERECQRLQLAANTWVVTANDASTDVYLVCRGRLCVVVSLADRETILRTLGDGEYFGELAAVDRKPRSAGVRTLTNATLFRMPSATFRAAIHEFPDVCDQVLLVLAGQVRQLANRANELAGLTVKQRIWTELLRSARPRMNTVGDGVISPPPTHAELASRIGSTREAVTRELGALEKNGLIERSPRAISLPKMARLRDMLEGEIGGLAGAEARVIVSAGSAAAGSLRGPGWQRLSVSQRIPEPVDDL